MMTIYVFPRRVAICSVWLQYHDICFCCMGPGTVRFVSLEGVSVPLLLNICYEEGAGGTEATFRPGSRYRHQPIHTLRWPPPGTEAPREYEK